jgi:hypothetical protein
VSHVNALRYALGSIAAGAVMMAPGVAAADTKSFQGDDWSIDYDSRTRMKTCDEEADSHKVHSDIKNQVGSQIGNFSVDGDGANGVCGFGRFNDSHSWVTQHRTVESRPLGDAFGNWVNT